MLSDALVAAAIASANGGPPLAWVGKSESMELGEALSAMLSSWVPQSAAQVVKRFMSELHAHAPAADGGAAWAQEGSDEAADFRFDLTALGLHGTLGASFSPSLHLGKGEGQPNKQAAKSSKRSADGMPKSPESSPGSKRAKLGEPSWQLVDCVTRESTVVQAGSELLFGRTSKCDIVVNSPAVSSKHCTVSCTRFGLQLEDLQSVNGTFVNDRRVLPGAAVGLKAGDVIALASRTGHRFNVQDGTPRGSPQQAVGSAARAQSGEKQSAASSVDPEKPHPAASQPGPSVGDVVDHLAEMPEAPAAEVKPPVFSPTPPPRRRLRSKTNILRDEVLSADRKPMPAPAHPKQRLSSKTSSVPWDPRNSMDGCVADPAVSPCAPAAEDSLVPTPVPSTAKDAAQNCPADSAESAEAQASEDLEERIALSVLATVTDRSADFPRLVNLATGRVHNLPKDGVVTIGRRFDSDVVVEGPGVSSRHCVLLCGQGHTVVEDVSSNGTFVNETRMPKGFALPQHVTLMDGDRLTMAHRDGPSLLYVPANSEVA